MFDDTRTLPLIGDVAGIPMLDSRQRTIPPGSRLKRGLTLKDRAAKGEDPFMIGKDHRKAVERLSDQRARINDGRRHVQSQQNDRNY